MKRFLSLLLALSCLLVLAPAASAASDEATEAAEILYELGLFKGTGTDPDGTPIFDLDKTPTRNQAIIMLVRLLGKEDEALAGTWDIPFTDVTDAMRPYVGYAYAHGLTNGYTATSYQGTVPVRANQYVTFVLRALGYESGKDFQVSTACDFSDSLGITDSSYTSGSDFTRGDVTTISRSALSAAIAGTETSLLEKLKADGAVAQDAALPEQDAPAGEEEAQEEAFTLTAFGDQWIHEYLMALGPSSASLGPDRPAELSHFDLYYYSGQYIAGQIEADIQQHYTFVRVFTPTESGTYLGEKLTNPGTRVETLESDVYGRYIAVATFATDGYFYETMYVLR